MQEGEKRMRKSMKKMLLGCLTAAMLLTVSAVSVFAAKGTDDVMKKQQEKENTFVNDTKDVSYVTYAVVSKMNYKQTGAGRKSITVSFERISGAKKYKIRYCLYGSTRVQTKVTTSNRVTITGLRENARYLVYVAAFNGNNKTIGMSDMKWLKTAPKKPTVTSIHTPNGNKLLVSLKNPGVAQGYRISYTDYKTKKTRNYYVGKSGGTVYFPAGGFTRVSINGYVTCSGKKYYGPVYATYLCAQPKISKKSNTSSSMTFSWSKVSGASNYSVYVSTQPNSGYRKVSTTKGTTYTYKNMQKGRYYYVYVRANKVVNGKTYSSPVSYYYSMYV